MVAWGVAVRAQCIRTRQNGGSAACSLCQPNLVLVVGGGLQLPLRLRLARLQLPAVGLQLLQRAHRVRRSLLRCLQLHGRAAAGSE